MRFHPTELADFPEPDDGWGLVLSASVRHEWIGSSGGTRRGPHRRYHNFFRPSVWELDRLAWGLAKLLVAVFAPTGLLELAVDDTLSRKRGLMIYGTGLPHDPLLSSRAKPLTRWGHNGVVLTRIVRPPFGAPTKVWSLPIEFRLYRNRQGLTKGKKKAQTPKKPKRAPNHRTRPQRAVELISLGASWFPERRLLVRGASAYGGASVRQKLPANVDLIRPVPPKGALYEPAPTAPANHKGRPTKKGRRLPGLAAWADDPSPLWQTLVFDPFGLHATRQVKTREALYYQAGKDRLLTLVLGRDTQGQRPDQRFYGPRLDGDARQILSAYATRWSIEVTFENSKQWLGLEDPANRTEKAVRRTAPRALVPYRPIVLWFHQAGHRPRRFPDRPCIAASKNPRSPTCGPRGVA
jgi:hypothetical protein